MSGLGGSTMGFKYYGSPSPPPYEISSIRALSVLTNWLDSISSSG